MIQAELWSISLPKENYGFLPWLSYRTVALPTAVSGTDAFPCRMSEDIQLVLLYLFLPSARGQLEGFRDLQLEVLIGDTCSFREHENFELTTLKLHSLGFLRDFFLSFTNWKISNLEIIKVKRFSAFFAFSICIIVYHEIVMYKVVYEEKIQIVFMVHLCIHLFLIVLYIL